MQNTPTDSQGSGIAAALQLVLVLAGGVVLINLAVVAVDQIARGLGF